MLAEHHYRRELSRADTLSTLERVCAIADVPYARLRACFDTVIQADIDERDATAVETVVRNAYVDLRFIASAYGPAAQIERFGATFDGGDRDAHDGYLASIQAMSVMYGHMYEALQEDRAHPEEVLANEEMLEGIATTHEGLYGNTPEYPTEADVVGMIDDLLDAYGPHLHMLEALYARHVALGTKGTYRFSIPDAPLPGPAVSGESPQRPC